MNSSDSTVQQTPNHPDPAYTSHNLHNTSRRSYPAPEVDRAAEGLQVDPNGKYPWASTREIDSTSKHWIPSLRALASSEKETSRSEDGLIPDIHEENSEHGKVWGYKRRSFIITASICVLLVMCVSVGGALGGYYANKSTRASTSTSTPTTTATSVITSASTTTSTSRPAPTPITIEYDTDDADAVETGTTGMAHLPCTDAEVSSPSAPQAIPRNITNPYESPTGQHASFDITCRRGIPASLTIDNLRIFTMYNLTTCMDRCSEVKGCMGVLYGANLTRMVSDGLPGGNCLLKNAAWEPTRRRESWFASAVRRV